MIREYYVIHRPTSKELLDLGKRVIVTGTKRCANDSLIFLDMTVPAWDKDTVKYFTPYPECGGYDQPGQWYIMGGESQLVGPICKSSLLVHATAISWQPSLVHVTSLELNLYMYMRA